MVKTKKTISTHKSLNLNCSALPKSLMCDSFNVQPTKENNYHSNIGDNYETRIQTLQSKKIRHRCKDSDSKNGESLQVQHQLSYNLDSEVSKKSLNWQGGICA